MNSLSVARIQYECIFVLAYLLSLTRIPYEFITFNWLLITRNNYEFIIFVVKSFWIHFYEGEFIAFFANSLSFTRIHDGLSFFVNSESIYYLLCEDTLNSLSISKIYFEFTINFANLLWIHYLFRQLTMYWPYFALNHYELTIFFRENTVENT